jgi:glycosyltransferase involved in cell wall biosynthesis
MSKMNILVLGNFGLFDKSLNGQTIRTQSIFEIINQVNNNLEIKLKKIDSSNLKSNLLLRLIYFSHLLIYLITSKVIIILPAQRAIKFYLPFFYYFKKTLGKKILFVAIGGWLDVFLDGNPSYVQYLKGLDRIYLQTNGLKEKLEKRNLSNLHYLPNFRIYNNDDLPIVKNESQFSRIVFYSRVIEEKGVELLLEVINSINETSIYNLYLDLYGPVEEVYLKFLNENYIKDDKVKYQGIILPSNVRKTLSKYDLMVFPTNYYGEGFPGAILDAFSSGLPVLSSNFHYSSEVIQSGYNGFVFNANDKKDLTKWIIYAVENPRVIQSMRQNCLRSSEIYDYQIATKEFINHLKDLFA